MIALDAESIGAAGWRVEVRDEVVSTSDVIREAGQAGAAGGLVVFAEHQTRGRGRRQNAWLMPRGKGIMFSALLRPDAPTELWPRVTTLAALAVCKAIEHELPLRAAIKWPNDVYIGDRKACGLLAECHSGAGGMFLCLGIGINANNTDFPDELRESATSLLREVSGEWPEIDRNALASTVLCCLSAELARIDDGFNDAVAEVRARSWLLGKTIRCLVDGRELHGRAIDLNHEGHLVLALPDGSSRALSSADEVRRVV